MLSKYHETSLILPVEYYNYPSDKFMLSDTSSLLEVRVKSPGFSILFFHAFNNSKLMLDINLANSIPNSNGVEKFWLINSNRQKIKELLPSSMDLISINPIRIAIDFSNKMSKKVPIKLNSNIIIQSETWLSKPVEIVPDSTTIYADQNKLDSIYFIETDELNLLNISESQSHSIALKYINDIYFDIDSINVNIDIEDFIEQTMLFNIIVKNLKSGYKIKLYPDNIEITLRVSKQNYNILQTDLFNVIVDASLISENKRKLDVIVKDLPSFIKLERIYPSSVEFMLIKE